MKIILSIALMLIAFSVSASTQTKNPIVGTWQIKAEGTSCIETYTFKNNGKRLYKSAAEVGESKFTISADPSTTGYYKFTDVIVKSNGKPDCMNHSSPVGDSLEAFVRFEAHGNSFFFCQAESPAGCVGPFIRAAGHSEP